MMGRRTGNRPWKHIYGVDRKYTERVRRLNARLVDAILTENGKAGKLPEAMRA